MPAGHHVVGREARANWARSLGAVKPPRSSQSVSKSRSRRPSPHQTIHDTHPLPDMAVVRIVIQLSKRWRRLTIEKALACLQLPSPSRQNKIRPDQERTLPMNATLFAARFAASGLGCRLRTPHARRIGPHRDDGANAGWADHDRTEPQVSDFTLPAPRIALLQPWRPCSRIPCWTGSITPWARATPIWPACGCARCPMRTRLGGHPDDEQAVIDILDWASPQRGRDPHGGGSSVWAAWKPLWAAVAARPCRWTWSAQPRAGGPHQPRRPHPGRRAGPELEAQLAAWLHLRHYPQSFRVLDPGRLDRDPQAATTPRQTHIDDLVESTRMVTPSGVCASRRLPASGAGPSPDRMVLGSEGTLGVVTEAWMRLQERPATAPTPPCASPTTNKACNAYGPWRNRACTPATAACWTRWKPCSPGVGDGSAAVMVLGFESADHPMNEWMRRALEVVRDHGGSYDAESVERSMRDDGGEEHRSGTAGAWRQAMPSCACPTGVTLPWAMVSSWTPSRPPPPGDRFEAFCKGVRKDVAQAVQQATGHPAFVSCRFTHIYPDGPAPHFTIAALAVRRAMWHPLWPPGARSSKPPTRP